MFSLISCFRARLTNIIITFASSLLLKRNFLSVYDVVCLLFRLVQNHPFALCNTFLVWLQNFLFYLCLDSCKSLLLCAFVKVRSILELERDLRFINFKENISLYLLVWLNKKYIQWCIYVWTRKLFVFFIYIYLKPLQKKKKKYIFSMMIIPSNSCIILSRMSNDSLYLTLFS